nr:hypothetical protein [uncultured Psychrobacter sp.]
MKTSVTPKKLQNKLWIALLASVIGLSACSNEREDATDVSTAPDTADMTTTNDNIQSTDTQADEMAPVATPTDNETSTTTATTSTDATKNDGDETYYSGVDSTEDEEKGVDAVVVNENNPNLDQTPAEGVQ